MRQRLFERLCIALLVIAAGAARSGPARAAGEAAEAVPGEILVGVREGRAAHLVEAVGRAVGYSAALRAYRLRLRPGLTIEEAIARLCARPEVRYAEPNCILRACTVPNDPLYSKQYGPKRVKADLSWDLWQPQAKVVLAIIDTGMDATHPDLADVMYRDAAGAVIGWNTQTGAPNAQDDHGHGTHCGGIAAARINNGVGIAGIAGWNPGVPGADTYVKLMPVKALDKQGNGTVANVADGVTWAADHGAKVLSMSLGDTHFSTTLNDAVQYAWGKGCVVVAAAGNEGSAARFYPAAYDNVLSVAATESTDTLTGFSNYGPWVKTAAPGYLVYSTLPTYPTVSGLGTTYGYLSGTSMSCPHAAGAAAALLAQNPTLSNREVAALLTANVDSYIPGGGHTLAAGAGRINVQRAVKAAGTGTPVFTAIALNPPAMAGGDTARGTVFLGGRAPFGGVTVRLASSDSALAAVPAGITVPEGASSAAFSVTTSPVAAKTAVTLTASSGGATDALTLTLAPLALFNVIIAPGSVVSGVSAAGTVFLNGPAAAGSVTVRLASSHPAVAAVPESVTILAGQASAAFSITTGPVAVNTRVTLSASYGGGVKIASLIVRPIAPAALTIHPTGVIGGAPATGTITLNAPVPPGDISVVLASSNPGAAAVPPNVIVPAGQTSAAFSITTYPTAPTASVTLSASRSGTTRSGRLTVRAPVVASLSLSPNRVTGGSPSVGTVTLSGPAPAAGFVVALTRSRPAVASVPPSVVVPAGQSIAAFSITTSPVTANTVVILSATAPGGGRSAALTVTK